MTISGSKAISYFATTSRSFLEKPRSKRVVIGAVRGDLHGIGYALVAKQLELAGFEVRELGVNIPAMSFIDKAQEVNADIMGLSAFLVTTIPSCSKVIDYLRAARYEPEGSLQGDHRRRGDEPGEGRRVGRRRLGGERRPGGRALQESDGCRSRGICVSCPARLAADPDR